MKKFYLRKSKKGNLRWYAKKKNGKFRKVTKEEKDEIQARFDSIPRMSMPYMRLPNDYA